MQYLVWLPLTHPRASQYCTFHVTILIWSFVFPQKEKDSFPACCAEADAWSPGPEVGGLDWNVLADPWAASMQGLVAMVGNLICAICTDGTSILALYKC